MKNYLLLLFYFINISYIYSQDLDYKTYISSRQYREAKLKTYTSTFQLSFSDTLSIKEYVKELIDNKDKDKIVNDLLLLNQNPNVTIKTKNYIKNYRDLSNQIKMLSPANNFVPSIWPKTDIIWVDVGEPMQNATGDGTYSYLVQVDFIKRVITKIPMYDMNITMLNPKRLIHDTSYLNCRTIFKFPKPECDDSCEFEDPKVHRSVELYKPYSEKLLCLTFEKDQLNEQDWFIDNKKYMSSMYFIKNTGNTFVNFTTKDFNNNCSISILIDSLLSKYHKDGYPSPYTTTPEIKKGFSLGFLSEISPVNRIQFVSENIKQIGYSLGFTFYVSKLLTHKKLNNWYYRIGVGYHNYTSNLSLSDYTDFISNSTDPENNNYTRIVKNNLAKEKLEMSSLSISYSFVKPRRLNFSSWVYFVGDIGLLKFLSTSYSTNLFSKISGKYSSDFYNIILSQNGINDFGYNNSSYSGISNLTKSIGIYLQPGIGFQKEIRGICFQFEADYQLNLINPTFEKKEFLFNNINDKNSISNLGSNLNLSGLIFKIGIIHRL